MAKKELTYKAAVSEIERILEQIEEGELDVDEITRNVKKVTELLRFCREKLHKTEAEVNNILKEEEDD